MTDSNEFGLPQPTIQPKKKTKKGLFIFLMLFFLLMLSLGSYYWLSQMGNTNISEEDNMIEDNTLTQNVDNLEEEQNIDNENLNIVENLQKEEIKTSENTTGNIYTVTKKEKKYYIIAGSFIDEDLAKDQAKKIIQHVLNAYIKITANNKHFYPLPYFNF